MDIQDACRLVDRLQKAWNKGRSVYDPPYHHQSDPYLGHYWPGYGSVRRAVDGPALLEMEKRFCSSPDRDEQYRITRNAIALVNRAFAE
jgi:hypothetical protein